WAPRSMAGDMVADVRRRSLLRSRSWVRELSFRASAETRPSGHVIVLPHRQGNRRPGRLCCWPAYDARARLGIDPPAIRHAPLRMRRLAPVLLAFLLPPG